MSSPKPPALPLSPDSTGYQKVKDASSGLAGAITGLGASLANRALGAGLAAVVPDFDNQSNEEVRAELDQRLRRIGIIVNELAKDPEIQQIIDNSSDALAKLTKGLVEGATPPLLELTDTATEMVSQMIIKTGESLSKTATKLLMAVVAEIPGLGGAVDLAIAGATAFNGVASNIEIASDNVIKMIEIGNELVGNTLGPVNDSLEDFKRVRQEYQQTLGRIEGRLNAATETAENLQNVSSDPLLTPMDRLRAEAQSNPKPQFRPQPQPRPRSPEPQFKPRPQPRPRSPAPQSRPQSRPRPRPRPRSPAPRPRPLIR
jgi:hypothetical protein